MILAVFLAQLATAAEYRQVTLVDGRVFVAEVLASGERGMEVAIPQGQMRVAFTDVVTLTAATEAEWSRQAPWRVLVSPLRPADGVGDAAIQGADRALRDAISDIPGITLLPPPSEAEAFGIRACGLDLGCARSAIPDRKIDVLVAGVVGNPTGTAVELSLASIWIDFPSATRRASVLQAPGIESFAELSEVNAATHAVLGLVPSVHTSVVTTAPPPLVVMRDRPAPTVRPGLVYVPVPGLPAFVGGNPKLGIAAWAIALPLAGGLVWAAGETTHEPAEFAIATAVGTYLSIVVSNAITQPPLSRPKVATTP